MENRDKTLLISILLIAAIIRICGFWNFSLTNDELSALARLNFSSFRDLIMEGVRIDGHPPAAQVILWFMTNWFGNSVLVVRLPFVLAGTAAMYFIFRTAQEWIGNSAALLTTATYSVLSFPVLYSRIARPYALGMLFVAVASFFWIRIIKEKGRNTDYIGLAISLALCAYSHYFAALDAALLAIFGLILIRGNALKKYVLALIGAFLLFAPYLPIFKYQLSMGGVGQWLGAPDNDWILKHISYAFNDSPVILLLILLSSAIGFILCRKRMNFLQTILPLLLFLAPFAVGFFYSKWVNPVLQNSMLLFSFPFFLIFLFSGWTDSKKHFASIFSTVIFLLILADGISARMFVSSNHFGVFKELANDISAWSNEVDDQALLIGDFNAPSYIHYYLDEIDTLKMSLYRVTDEKGIASLKSIIDTSTSPFVIYSWSTIVQDVEIEDIIRYKYPKEIKRRSYCNSEAVMFSRGNTTQPDAVFEFTKNTYWNLNPEKVKEDSTGQNHVLIDEESPYGPTFIIDLEDLVKDGVRSVSVLVESSDLSDSTEVQMVYEQQNSSGTYWWESDMFRRQFTRIGPNWGVFHYNLFLNQDTLGVLKIYPWSPEGEVFNLSKMELRFYQSRMPINNTSSNCGRSPFQSSKPRSTILSCLRGLS